MGTLTADCPRLDAHCPHKLATSCRLTSTWNCCACADERPHSRTYAVYIDGVGFVQRGTRWQSYCWFCKEFWNNRLACTYPSLETSQTKIPQIPDQSEFLQRWFEFHQGYRLARRSDETEQRIAVIGEPFGEVSPGFLPRTLDQLRSGRVNDHTRPENRFRRERIQEDNESEQVPHQTLEDALDSLLEEVSDEETGQRASEETSQLLERDATMPRQREPRGLSRPLSRSDRARQNITRLFGTREEINAPDYQSPISGMFSRAWDRFSQAEARRATGDTVAPPVDTLSPPERREIEQQIIWGVVQQSTPNLEVFNSRHASPASTDRIEPAPRLSWDRSPTRLRSVASESMMQSPGQSPFSHGGASPFEHLPLDLSHARRVRDRQRGMPGATLDNQPNRPPPLKDAQMTKSLACQVCYCQIADMALLPCGHMVMCEYCADVVIPVKNQQFPLRPSKCPMCRKQVKQRIRIHFG